MLCILEKGEVARAFSYASVLQNTSIRKKETGTWSRLPIDAIAKKLIEVETIEREDFEKILIAHGIVPKKKQDIEHQPIV